MLRAEAGKTLGSEVASCSARTQGSQGILDHGQLKIHVIGSY